MVYQIYHHNHPMRQAAALLFANYFRPRICLYETPKAHSQGIGGKCCGIFRFPFEGSVPEWSPVEAFWRCGQFASTGKVLTNPPEMGVGHRAVAAQQFLLVHASLCVVCILMLMQVLPLSVGASLGSYCQFGM